MAEMSAASAESERVLTWKVNGEDVPLMNVGLNAEGQVESISYLGDYAGFNPDVQEVLDFYELETWVMP